MFLRMGISKTKELLVVQLSYGSMSEAKVFLFLVFWGGGLIKCLDQLVAHLWICVQETSRDHFDI